MLLALELGHGRCLSRLWGDCWKGLKICKEGVIGSWRKTDFLLHNDEELSTTSTCSNMEETDKVPNNLIDPAKEIFRQQVQSVHYIL